MDNPCTDGTDDHVEETGMLLKRMILLIALCVMLAGTAAWGQETGPLVMRVEFEWTVAGAVAGVAVGALLWLTDPANPSNNLADSLAAGAAWGSILGAGFGVFVLQRSAIPPAGVVMDDPLNPRNRISADPVAVQSGDRFSLAQRNAVGPPAIGLRVPLLNLHF